jgi:peptidoglycan hydrolase CwlO-like protein
MTSTTYFFCRIAQIFGYRRKNIRMTAAADETHLLKEAESQLGKAVWENVENIEALSVEYWSLRKIIKERHRIAAELERQQGKLNTAHHERIDLFGAPNEPFQALFDERQAITQMLDELTKQRDEIITNAREIRRSHEGAKTKQEVLTKEGTGKEADLAHVTSKLAELNSEFSRLKTERENIGKRISDGEAKIEAINAKIKKQTEMQREKASKTSHHIGHANQELSSLRAELSALDTQLHQIYTEIGKHISRNPKNPEYRKACKNALWLIDVVDVLRKSILLNHKLAENA